MHTRDLACFLALSQTLNYTTAAERCFVTRQAMRQTVQRLEAQFGTALVNNERNRLTLTPAGRTLSEGIPDVLRACDNLRAAVTAHETCAPLRIGFSASLLPFYAPLVAQRLSAFVRAHPEIPTRIASMPADAVLSGLASGALDAGVVLDMDGAAHPFARTVLRRDTLGFLMTPQHPRFDPRGLRLTGLEGQTIHLMSDPKVCFAPLYAALAEAGCAVNYQVTVTQSEAYNRAYDPDTLVLDCLYTRIPDSDFSPLRVLPLLGFAQPLCCTLLCAPAASHSLSLLRAFMRTRGQAEPDAPI